MKIDMIRIESRYYSIWVQREGYANVHYLAETFRSPGKLTIYY